MSLQITFHLEMPLEIRGFSVLFYYFQKRSVGTKSNIHLNPYRFFLSGAEVIATAEQQLETAGGIEDTPFVTITVTVDAADSTKRIVSAYQV